MSIELNGTGVWSTELRYGDPVAVAAAAAELVELGYTALWVPDVGGPMFDALDLLLRATRTVSVATGILNVWQHTPQEVGAWWHDLDAGPRSRVVLGRAEHQPRADRGRPLHPSAREALTRPRPELTLVAGQHRQRRSHYAPAARRPR